MDRSETGDAPLRQEALRIAAIYAGFGLAWVVVADRLIGLLDGLPGAREFLLANQSALYVLITACLVYFLVRHHASHLQRSHGSDAGRPRGEPGREFAGSLAHRALRIAAIYAVLGLLWVTLGEHYLEVLIADPAFESAFMQHKTSLYVLLTALLVYYLVWIHVGRIREVELMLHDSDRRLHQVIDLVPHMIFARDRSGRYILANQATADALDTTVEELLARGPPRPAGLPNGAEGIGAVEQEVLATKSARFVPAQVLTGRDGEKRVLQTTIIPYSDRNAGGDAVLGVSIDITDRQLAEQRLQEQKERAQITLDSIGDAVITTDAGGRIDYMNPAAERLTAWKLEEARGQKLENVFRTVDSQSRERVADPVSWAMEEGLAIGLLDRNVLISRTGERHAIQDSTAPIRGPDGDILGVVLIFKDVTETRRLAQRLAHHATHDSLTGLVNRREFERRLEHALFSARRFGTRHALYYIDLDQFKVVNDTAGHAAGDELLKELATVLVRKVRARDTVARLGGDEFTLLVENCPLEKAMEIGHVLLATVRDYRFHWEGRTFEVSVSIGLVPVEPEAGSAAELLTRSDVACYAAKDLGRNRMHVYQADDAYLRQRHADIHRAAALSDALQKRRLCLFGQPIMPLAEGSSEPLDTELLVRLQDSEGNLIMPADFIPAAERYGMMTAIDRWVINNGLRLFRRQIEAGTSSGLAINLSGTSLNDDTLLAYVRDEFERSGVPPGRVSFEITETAAIINLDRAAEFIAELKQAGCRFALDDFGSGLSSFSYLKSLPVDYIKIDGTFVRDMDRDRIDRAMVGAINQVGHIMGLETIAECADRGSIVEQLREMGVDYAQGFALGYPQPVRDVA